MKNITSTIVLLLVVLFFSVDVILAQTFNRTPTPNDTLKSIRVDKSGIVTFQIYAPNAQKVSVVGEMGYNNFKDLIKKENGVWIGSTSALASGVYRYSFVVDGLQVSDPKNPVVKENAAMIEVYGNGSDFWATKDVPHGDVRTVWYSSKSAKTTRRMHIYTPPGYDKSTKSLPVLYLIHGGGDNDNSWPTVGKANFIFDNLIAQGKIQPMMVVMPDGSIDIKTFTEDLAKDIVPYVEANYKVASGPKNRALAGLSMGGLEVMEVFMAYPDMFSFINVMSSGWFTNNKEMYESGDKRLAKIANTLNNSAKYLLFTQGGPEDIAYNNCKEMLKIFDKNKIKYEFSEMPGGHSWVVWKNDLLNFAQKIFK